MSGYFPKVRLSEAERRRMTAIADALPTKAARIRALDAAGFTRQAIATFLQIRYQHVRNALVNRPAGEAIGTPSASPSPARAAPGLGDVPRYGRCQVDDL